MPERSEWKDEIVKRLASLRLAPTREAEIIEELAQHLEDRYQELRTGGVTEAEARRVALEELSDNEALVDELRRVEDSMPKEPVTWGQRTQGNMLADLVQDLRYGLRMLAKNRGFTIVAVLTLALGIGANTAMFSVIEAVLLRPLPYSDANQLVRVASVWAREGITTPYSSSPPDFFDWRDQNRSFSSMFAYNTGEYALTGRAEAKRVHAVLATAGMFSALQARPLLGREFVPEENRKGADHVVVLSYGLWQAEFGGMPDAIGRTIELDSEPYTVIGVMPAEFRFPLEGSDAYVPLGFDDKVMTQRGAHYVSVLGRLRSGVSLAQANDDLGRIMAQLRKLYPDKDGKWGVRADRWSSSLVGDIRPALLVLLGAVGLVALIACANISNLLLARATMRHREFAMRMALGAARARLARQVLTEGLLLALLAGAASLVLAHWALMAIVLFGPKDIPRLSSVGMNAAVLAFTLGVSVASAMLVGLIPALRSSGMDVSGLLTMSASSSREAGRARNVLLIGEVAVSMMLLAGAGLLVRSFIRLRSLSPGFDATNVLTLDIGVPDAHYKNSLALQGYWDEVLATVRSLPGVKSAGAVTPLPLSGDDFSSSFRVEGRTVPEKDEPSAEVRWATPDYFRSMAVPLRQGRLFTDADRLGAARVLLLSEGAARTFFPAGDAMGRKITFGARGGYEKNEGEIVGIVGDVRHYGLDAPAPPMFYVPLAQAGMDGTTVVIRAQGVPAALGQPARKLLQAIDRDALVGEPVLLETLVAGSLGQRRFYLMLMGAFAALALVLAVVGLYGVISYSVAQRTQEIGIRMALGATRRQVLSMVMRRGLWFAGSGLAAGQVLALMLNRTLKGLLVGVSTTDPLTLGVTGAVLLVAAVLACYLPARRATRVDPLVALRYE
ncbi:MAG: ADOP family duplicated permease [Terriglobia bacterium]